MKNIFYLFLIILFESCSGDDLPEITPNLPPRPGTFNPTLIFTDQSCTALREGVTKALVDSICDNKMYREMALQMLDGTYPSEFRIMHVEPLPEPSVDASINKTAKYGVMDYPTGISLMSGDTLHVFASGLETTGAATLKIQTLTTATTGGYGSGPAAIPLSNGENIIVAGILPGGGYGLGYIRYYYTDMTKKPANININIFGGAVNGCFDLRKHTNADWQRLISAAVNPYFDIVGKYATVTAPTDWFRQNTGGRGKDLVDAYDAVVYLEWKFMGLLDPPNGFGGKHRTRAYFHHEVMGTGVGAYASDYHTAYPGNYMTKPDAIVGSDVWVFGHEHGHVNQTRPAFRWAGMVEVTNNLEAMYLRTHARDLVPTSTNTAINTNLQTVTDGGYVNTYERAFNWYFGKDRPLATPTPHHRNDNNAHLFHQLVPFWQLYLYLDNVLGKTGTHGASFYEDIYEHYRKYDSG
ncbi:MAG: M60 family metallopeptidase, partial [Odoribacteraceae bacterium]|nr:M60 family metallopeptidase [Odoribacteraceae bacterium]